MRGVADRTGTRIDPGGTPRHAAVMAWDPDAAGNDPGTLARRAEIAHGARLILYPAPGNVHSALARLLADDIQAACDQLSERFRAGLYVTRQNQPLFTATT